MPPTAAAPMPEMPRLRVAGHFGELVQGRLPSGEVALISLPCPALWVEAGADLIVDHGPLLVGAARLTALCAALGLPLPVSAPRLSATMPPGGGAGSSTAALVATARALGFDGPPEAMARACVLAEGASDPLMFSRAETLLFAPREGRVLAPLPALPRFEVLGGFLGPGLRTDPADLGFPPIGDLLDGWPGADLDAMAARVTQSARRTLAMRGPGDDPSDALARDLGALGFVIAHTGSARGFLFAPGSVPEGGAAFLQRAGFAGILRFDAGGGT